MKDDFYKYKMNIDVRSTDCVYITINGWTYYIDDSLEYIDNIDKALKGTENPVENPDLLERRKKK